MSNIVVLTPNKSLVRIKTSVYELKNLEIDTFGMLRGFFVNDTRYLFIDKSDYLERDQTKDNLLIGFVKYESYIEYVSSSQKNIYNYKYILNSTFWYDVNFESAKLGDIFRINKLETSPAANMTNGYRKYFVYLSCEFKINDFNIDFTNTSQYPPVNSNEASPNYCKIVIDDKSNNLSDTAQSKFFRKNLGNKIASLPSTVSDEAKKILYAGLIKICWRINNLFKDALDKIAIKNLSDIYDIVITTNLPTGTNIKTFINNHQDLTDIDKVIANLLVDWGYRDYEDTLELFPLNTEKDQFYGGYYVPFQNYYNTLVNVYTNLAYSRESYLFGTTTNPSTWTPEFTKKQSNLRLEMLVSIIPDGAINFLDFDTKIKILKKFATNRVYESREDAVIKIVRSIQVNDALKFLNRLKSETLLIDSKSMTLFQALYDKVNDKIFLFGKNNRRELINRFYSLWYISTLNPYNALDMDLANNDPTTTKDYYTSLYKDKPIALNYNPEKNFGFFVDNMNFEFNSKNITVFEEKEGSQVIVGGETVPKKEFINIGDYDFYAAISIKGFKEGDVAVKLPAISLEQNGNNKSYIIPLFYLKYLDDFGENEDIWTAIGLTIDIALTFTGVGNISKLRHFRHLSKLGRLALGETLTVSERVLVLEAISGASAFVELTSSVASLILQHYTTGCKDYISEVKNNINDNTPEGSLPTNSAYEWCRTLDQFLFWAQMMSAGGDFISGYMLRKTARKLEQIGIPSNFPAGGKQFINDIADLDGALIDFLNSIKNSHPNVHNRVSAFANDEDKFSFMFDYKKNSLGLQAIEHDLNSSTVHKLIDDWIQVVDDLKHLRKDINYLKSYNRFTVKEHELTHVTDFHNGKHATGGFDPKGAHAGKNLGNGVIRDPNLPAPPGKANATSIKDQLNGHIAYRHLYFIKPDGTFKSKSLHTIFNPAWDDLRIKGEMAFAFKNKRLAYAPLNTGKEIEHFSPPPVIESIYMSSLTDGTKVRIKIYNFNDDPVTEVVQRDHLGFFELILK